MVRVAAANLNCSYAKLVQEKARPGNRKHPWVAPTLRATGLKHARPTAFRLIAGSSHSGKDMGILRSVRNDQRPHPSVDAVLECLRVRTGRDYRALCERFDAANAELQKQELVEVEQRILKDRVFIHDPHSMVIFRVIDDHGQPVGDFDIRLTSGDPPDPNALPEGFFRDRQANRRGPGTITYFVNANVMLGADPVVDPRNEEKVLRDRLPGAGSLGFEVEPHRTDGFVHHLEATLNATRPYLRRFVRPNETTLVDIHMRRVVRRGVFELTKEQGAKDFKNQPKGEPLSRDRG